MTQHFYDENRKLLVLKERLHHTKALASTYDDLNESTDRPEGRDDYENERQHGSHEADETNATIPADATNTNPNDKDHNSAYMTQLKQDFRRAYRRMDNSKKMHLSGGKCVEDELFCFGMQCNDEHQSHSFIIDPSDANRTKYDVFSEEELLEIEAYHEKPTPEIPVPLRDYLNRFNKSTTAELSPWKPTKTTTRKPITNTTGFAIHVIIIL